jgi:hypothetical protein
LQCSGLAELFLPRACERLFGALAEAAPGRLIESTAGSVHSKDAYGKPENAASKSSSVCKTCTDSPCSRAACAIQA